MYRKKSRKEIKSLAFVHIPFMYKMSEKLFIVVEMKCGEHKHVVDADVEN